MFYQYMKIKTKTFKRQYTITSQNMKTENVILTKTQKP